MKEQTASQRMYPLLVQYDMHNTFFKNVLAGIEDRDAQNRLNTKANHIAWLTGSLVQERFEMAKALGIEEQQAAHELFANHQGIKDDADYPSLESFKKDWDRITPLLQHAFAEATDEWLDSSFEMMPGQSMKWFEMVSFMMYREANCIGQIALWRRLLGYPAMKYM